jgi:hypothetical protein
MLNGIRNTGSEPLHFFYASADEIAYRFTGDT